jgi:heme oxygenase
MTGTENTSARFTLRAATHEAHERLDALFSSFDLTHRAGYGDFLMAQAGAFESVETALDRAGAAEVVADWAERRRADALAADLAVMGLAAPDPIAAPAFATEAEVLGGLYVLEGSRLGGAMLVRSVPDTLPKTFLSPGNPAAWRAFVTVLDERLSSPAKLSEATASALAVFEAFASSARRVTGAVPA